MGREGENLPLARASRPSAATPCRASSAALGGYRSGRLSFGNEGSRRQLFLLDIGRRRRGGLTLRPGRFDQVCRSGTLPEDRHQ
jgi:hypothetical protein